MKINRLSLDVSGFTAGSEHRINSGGIDVMLTNIKEAPVVIEALQDKIASFEEGE